MARVPLVKDDETDAFEAFKDLGRPPSDIFRALANIPSLMLAHTALP